jgi:hypothetical protein
MTQHWIQARAASIRGHWSANERRARAEAARHRFGELLVELGMWQQSCNLRLAPVTQSRPKSRA